MKFFNTQKGFGFITPDDGDADVFVHISAVEQSGLPELREGQTVEFQIEPGKGGKNSRDETEAALTIWRGPAYVFNQSRGGMRNVASVILGIFVLALFLQWIGTKPFPRGPSRPHALFKRRGSFRQVGRSPSGAANLHGNRDRIRKSRLEVQPSQNRPELTSGLRSGPISDFFSGSGRQPQRRPSLARPARSKADHGRALGRRGTARVFPRSEVQTPAARTGSAGVEPS